MTIVQAYRRISGGSVIVADSLRFTTCWRHFSTAFREERDTFGPIQVPSDKFVFFLCFLIFLISFLGSLAYNSRADAMAMFRGDLLFCQLFLIP